jgi:hypothetical protein
MGCSASSCDDIGSISISVLAAQDDSTPFDQMGLRMELVDGKLPGSAALYDYDVRIIQDGFFLAWGDGAKDKQESFDFTLSIRSVDLAGNVSQTATELRIKDPGRMGCATSPTNMGLLPLLLALLLLKKAMGRCILRKRY